MSNFQENNELSYVPFDESIIPQYLQEQANLESKIFNPTKKNCTEVANMMKNMTVSGRDIVRRMIIESAEVNRFKFDNLILALSQAKYPRVGFQNTLFSEYLVHKGIFLPTHLYDPVKMRGENAFKPFEDEIGYIIVNDDVKKIIYSSIDEDFFNSEITLNKGPYAQNISLLDLAAKAGSVKCFKYLLLNGACVSDKTADYAVEGGSLEIVEMCYQEGCDFSNSLKIAIKAHRNDIAEWILSNFAVVAPDLFLCITSFNTLALVYFVEHGLDINQRNKDQDTILHYIAYYGQYEWMKYLISKGADVDIRSDKDLTPLHLAVNQGYFKMVKILYDNGADINSKGQYGKTALHLAASNGHYQIVVFLIEHGAELECTTGKWNYTPLFLAASSNNLDIADYLISQGANIKAKGAYGDSLFHIAIHNNSLDLLDLLIKNNANINQTDDNGRTPLMEAARQGMEEFTRTLLENGAKKGLKDKKGKTALDLTKNDEIKDMLQ